MFYADLMKESVRIYGERGKQYGEMQACMEKTASIASLVIGKTITPFEVALVLHAVKMARMSQDIYNPDAYLDGINYLAIAGELALTSARTTQPIDQIDQDIAILAAKFAPRRPVEAVQDAETASF